MQVNFSGSNTCSGQTSIESGTPADFASWTAELMLQLDSCSRHYDLGGPVPVARAMLMEQNQHTP